ncbi:hemagglutinin repeat-containing protein [Dialister invisus]
MKGNVTITAGQTASVRASDIIAGKDTLITGRNVDIESKDNTYRGKEEHEYKKSGLTVSLGGAAVNAARTVAAPVKRAGEVGDGRLKALYALQAGMNARDIQKNQKTDKAINKNNAVGINISLGSTGWKDNRETATQEAKGSTITAGKTAAVIAKEDMIVKGSTIHAKDINLKAGNNIRILSSENKSTTIEDYKAKSGSIGASLSKGGYGIGASYGKGKGQIEETTLTHTPSDITAKNTVALSSGNDITIRGGTVKGNKVTANAGRMSIESEQDKKNYKETSKTSGLSISYTPGSAVTVSGGKGKTNTDSAYESVTKQAGIYAGKEGYDIQVKNNTHLKGAVIDSQAEKEKNRITTGTLTWENIENKAEYKTGGHGISYNGKIGRGDKNDPLDSQTNNRYGKDAITGQRNGMNKITPTIYGSKIPLNERGLLNTPVPSVKGTAGTTTRSAVSKGTITITDKENQKQDIEKLNRNTEDSLNKLKEIFDKTKVEERKQMLEELGIVGNRAIHEIASHNGWKDGSAEKIALHGMLGAITSAKSGGSALSGLIAGGANEYAIGYLEKSKGKDWINKHPDTVQNISAAFGEILSKMTGGSGHTGAYISQMGTKWNEYLLTQLERSNKDLLIQKEAERETYDKEKDYSQEEINNAIAQGIVKEKDYFMSLANAYPGGAGIALEMSAMSDYEIQQKYGNQMTLIGDRTYVINQDSSFAHTVINSINYTNAVGEAIRTVQTSGIRDQYVDFTVDIRSDSKTNKIFDNSSFLLAGAYSGNISIMIDSKGVIHEQSCLIDNYNFEKHSLSDSYEFNKIIELNNEAALSMQAGRLTPFMWILYINRTFSRFGINNEGE